MVRHSTGVQGWGWVGVMYRVQGTGVGVGVGAGVHGRVRLWYVCVRVIVGL